MKQIFYPQVRRVCHSFSSGVSVFVGMFTVFLSPPEKAKLITKEFMSLISPLVIYIVSWQTPRDKCLDFISEAVMNKHTHTHTFSNYAHTYTVAPTLSELDQKVWCDHTHTDPFTVLKRSHCKGNRIIYYSLMPSSVPTLDLSRPPSMFFLCLLSQLLSPASCSSNGDHRAAVSAAGGPGHGGYQGHKRYHDGRTALLVNPVSPHKPTI